MGFKSYIAVMNIGVPERYAHIYWCWLLSGLTEHCNRVEKYVSPYNECPN